MRLESAGIERLLIANRGEIARRVIRSAHAMGIHCIAVYVDADAGAPFVSDADESVRLPDSYLDRAAILDAARATDADAIHPGYGFLSENASFAAEVIAAGRIWVGPSPETIEQLGDKLAAKALAQESGIPILPGAEDPSQADAIGYPLLVKAVAGGGGKGMRLVTTREQLGEALVSARREAAGSFGDGRVFLERHVARARHIEIQILGDAHGNIVQLGERECSIQRRHQKIIEESPSPRVDPSMREAIGDAALRLARAISYQSAGTVEFLVDDETGEFFFLEVNARLQVEHPVTEAVTGIDLVREQLRIAAGARLDCAQEDIQTSGWAIEARLCAEDPSCKFLPATGTLIAFEPAQSPEVRWDTGVAVESEIGADFDPMLAKVIVHAPTRSEAARRLALSLERSHIGGVATNRDFLVAILRSAEFLDGDTTTDFIERVHPTLLIERDERERTRLARVAALWIQESNRSEAGVLGAAPSGWRNARLPDQLIVLAHGGHEIPVSYHSLRDGSFCMDGSTVARVHAWSKDAIDVEIDGHRSRSRVTRAGDRLVVHGTRGDLEFIVHPRHAPVRPAAVSGGLVAPMPGRLIDVRVNVGDTVRAGETLVVLEAMKMEHPVTADKDGVVEEIRVSSGDQVENGALLLIVTPDPSDDGTGAS